MIFVHVHSSGIHKFVRLQNTPSHPRFFQEHIFDTVKPPYTYLLTPWSRVLLEKLTGFTAYQEIPRILWNPKVNYRTHKRPYS